MISNIELWNQLRKAYPHFKSHTSEGTRELFTETGFEAIKLNDYKALNEFFELSIRVHLQTVNISHAVDKLEEQGFGEYYDVPFGGIIQRMAVNSVKPVTPAYRGLKNFDTVDPFVVRKPDVKERFFKQNFDYQSLITIPDEFAMKQIFINEFGMSEFMAGIMESLNNGFKLQNYLNKLEALNAGLNSRNYPLKESQEVTMGFPWADDVTEEDLLSFVNTVKNLVSAMTTAAQTSAYNAMGFASTQDADRLVLLIRPSVKAALDTYLYRNSYNQEFVQLPVKIVEVPNFGGMKPTKEGDSAANELYPVYDKLGTIIGYNEQEGQSEVTVKIEDVKWIDPNEITLAVLCDKGYVFTSKQNPYTVEPIRNPRGLYTNYWASCPGGTVAADPLYNIVKLVGR